MVALHPILAVGLNLSVDNLLAGLVILVIAIILGVAGWRLLQPLLGQFAGIVIAIFAVIVILIVAHIFGIF